MVEERDFIQKNDFLHGGEFQYFRIKPVLWERNLPKLKEMKIDVVSSYVPWIWHELEERRFDFTGETHPMRNLVHFLSLVRENGLKLIIRLGPYIYAEYNGYGVPLWIREKYPECLIINEKGKRGVHVSYGHPKLMELVEKWYSTLYNIVKEFVEDGTIIAVQLDNETGLFLAGEVLNKVDYNPYVVSRFRLWLKEKYGNIDELNKIYKSSFSNFDSVDPPRGKIVHEYGIQWLDWLKFYQFYLVDYLRDLKRLLERAGFKVPIVLNDSILMLHPVRSKDKFRVGNLGLDIYVKVFPKWRYCFDFPFTSVFDAKYVNYYAERHGKMGWAAEVQSGYLDPNTHVSINETWQLAMSLISHGLKGFVWYIIHDCIEADGTPYAYRSAFDQHGNPTERFKVHEKIGSFIEEHKYLILNSGEIYDKVAYAHYENYNIKHLFSPIDVILESKNAKSFMGAVADNQWNYGFVDLEDATLEDLKKYNVLVFHTLGFLDVRTLEKLEKFVEEGGKLITFPTPVYMNESLESVESSIYPFEVKKIDKPSDKKVLLRFLAWKLKWKREKRKYLHRWSEQTLWSNYIINNSMSLLMKTAKDYMISGVFVGGFCKHVSLQPKPEANVRPLMFRDEVPFGYVVGYGEGTSIVLGTNLLAHYDTPYYYELTPKELKCIRIALNALIGVRRIVKMMEGTGEIVVRKIKDGYLLFIFNRGKEKRVEIRFNPEVFSEEKYRATCLASLGQIDIPREITEKKLALKLNSDDAAVIYLEPI